jgi:Ca-activated chloride channel family protein
MLLAADLPGVARAASDDPDIRADGEDGAVEGRHAPRPRSSPSPYVFGGIIAVVLVVVLATRFLFGGDGRLSQATGGGGRDCVGVTVASSPDKFPLLRQLAAGYAGSRPTVDGRCVTVTVTSKESAAAVAALARDWGGAADGPRPDVWMPSSTAWVALLQAQRGAGHRPNIVPPELPPVATTPLVLAMPRPVAERIGWPRRQPTWSQAYGLALQGWKAAGKPELGEFRMGTSDPFVSTAGLATLVASGYAAAELVHHTPTPLSLTVLGNELVQRTLLGFDRAVKERAQSSAELLDKLGRADRQDPSSVPRVFSALAVEEKSVLDYNQGNPGGDPSFDGRQPRPRVPLVAAYPSDGTVLADHPYVVLNVPWVDDAKRVAAGGFLEFLQAPGQQARFQQLGFRNHQGQAGPLATQRNGLLGSRRLSPLQTPEPRVVAALVKGYAQNRRKGNLLSLIDVSGSMRELVPGTRLTRMDLADRASLAALPLLSDEGSFGQWIFSTNLDGAKDYRQLVPLGPMGEVLPSGRTRRATLTALVGTLQPTNGDTGLYDSTWAAVQYMHRQYRADRLNAVVLITDGRNDDPGGGLTLDQLLARLRGQGKQVVHIIAIGYGPEADQAVLQKITAASAGVAIAVRDPRDIQRAFIEALQRF